MKNGISLNENMAAGTFGHHPDPVVDFCVEVDAIEGMFFDVAAGLETNEALSNRIEKAMSFRVGGDNAAISAKKFLRSRITMDTHHD